jgi:hypothetical protein
MAKRKLEITLSDEQEARLKAEMLARIAELRTEESQARGVVVQLTKQLAGATEDLAYVSSQVTEAREAFDSAWPPASKGEPEGNGKVAA